MNQKTLKRNCNYHNKPSQNDIESELQQAIFSTIPVLKIWGHYGSIAIHYYAAVVCSPIENN